MAVPFDFARQKRTAQSALAADAHVGLSPIAKISTCTRKYAAVAIILSKAPETASNMTAGSINVKS